MIYYILIDPEENYPDIADDTEGQVVAFDSGQFLLGISTPHHAYDDYVRYSKQQIDELRDSLYDDNYEFKGEVRYPSRKSEELIRLLKIQAGVLDGNS